MRKLIYFTISNNLEYIRLLKLCIDSLNKFEYDGDILFITNFENEIKNQIDFKNDVYFLDISGKDILTSSSNKMKIFEFEKIQNYEKIIYCDLDTIWLDSPQIIFDQIQEDKIYTSTEYHQKSLMSHEYWGGTLLTEDEIEHIERNKII